MSEETFNCEECRKSVYPTDPTVRWYNKRTDRYYHSLCEDCPYYMSPEYRIEKLEHKELMGRAEYADEWTRKQWDIVNQLKGEMIYLRQSFANTLKEIKEQSDAKQRPF